MLDTPVKISQVIAAKDLASEEEVWLALGLSSLNNEHYCEITKEDIETAQAVLSAKATLEEKLIAGHKTYSFCVESFDRRGLVKTILEQLGEIQLVAASLSKTPKLSRVSPARVELTFQASDTTAPLSNTLLTAVNALPIQQHYNDRLRRWVFTGKEAFSLVLKVIVPPQTQDWNHVIPLVKYLFDNGLHIKEFRLPDIKDNTAATIILESTSQGPFTEEDRKHWKEEITRQMQGLTVEELN